MKKLSLVLALVLTCSLALAGCGKEKVLTEVTPTPEATEEGAGEETAMEPVSPPSFEDVDLSKIVTLGEYRGLELERIINPVADEEVQAAINSALTNAPVPDADETVDDGDVANIDFVGKMDGVEFEGGAGTGFNLRIGSGQFVPGYEEGLIGAKKGETRDVTVTFPDDYYEDKAGKEAVFTVTVNDVLQILDEPTDEWVVANTEFETVDEYTASIKQAMVDENEMNADQEVAVEGFTKVVESSEVSEFPQEAIDYGVAMYKQNVEAYANSVGMTLEDYIAAQGSTMEQFNEEAKAMGDNVAKQMLVMNAIVQKEGFTVDSVEADEIFKGLEEQAQMAREDLIAQYGEAEINQTVMMRFVQKIIIDSAIITDVEAEDVVPTEGELPEGHSADDGHDH